jgi:hypothetical protein
MPPLLPGGKSRPGIAPRIRRRSGHMLRATLYSIRTGSTDSAGRDALAAGSTESSDPLKIYTLLTIPNQPT